MFPDKDVQTTYQLNFPNTRGPILSIIIITVISLMNRDIFFYRDSLVRVSRFIGESNKQFI